MLVINYKGITPQQRFYSHAVKGNNNANEIKFIVERYQYDLDLASLTPYLKVSNKCENYFDKIALTLTSNTDFVYLVWTMTSKSTQYRNLELQLQFQDVSVVFQTQIVELELNETIPAEKHIEEEHPTAIKQIEDDLKRIEKSVKDVEEDVKGKVDKTSQANKVYGTDENGNQILYPKDSFGQIEDVKVNGKSVVTDKVAEIDLTDYAKGSDLQAETERATNVENGLEDRIEDVEDLIPAQATPQNKLADKDFVNSSIATNTAYFKGTFNVVTELGLTIEATHEQIATALASAVSDPTNNDYAFVSFPDPTVPSEYTKFSRYKYNGETETWVFEFDLNNSSFTAQQWASINSGITAQMVNDLPFKSAGNTWVGSNYFKDIQVKSITFDGSSSYGEFDYEGGKFIFGDDIDGIRFTIGINGVLNENSNGYGLILPDTTSWTADKEIATTDQVVVKANESVISDQYDSTKTYAVGDIVIYNNVLYKCTIAVTTAEVFDSTKWTATKVSELVADETIIKLDTGSYSAGTPMSANDLAFFQPLLNMNVEQATNYLKHKIFIRLDSNRNETQTSIYFCVRVGGQAFDRAWYDIQISFNGFGSFTLTPARLGNGTY